MLTAVDQGHAHLPELMETVEVGELLMPAGCQERKTNADLLSFVHEREAREISEPVTLANPIAPVEIFPITEGKLAVSISGRGADSAQSDRETAIGLALEKTRCLPQRSW